MEKEEAGLIPCLMVLALPSLEGQWILEGLRMMRLDGELHLVVLF